MGGRKKRSIKTLPRDVILLLLALAVVQTSLLMLIFIQDPVIDYYQGWVLKASASIIPITAVAISKTQRRYIREVLIILLVLSWTGSSVLFVDYVTVWVMLAPLVILIRQVASIRTAAASGAIMLMPLLSALILSDDAAELGLMVISATVFVVLLLWHDHHNPEAKKRAPQHLSDQQFKALINSMADGVIAVDSNRKITLYNGAALNILNVNTSLEGKLLDSYLPLTNSKSRSVSMKTIFKRIHGYYVSRDYRLVFPDGDIISLYIGITPVRQSYGSSGSTGYVVLLRDITKEKSLEEERDEFISVISHELRTPIAITEGSISNAELLLANRRSKRKEVQEALDEAHKQAVFLAGLVNDLSTLSRAERGVLNVDPEHINVNDFIKQLGKDYRAEAKQKGLYLRVSTDRKLKKLVTSRLYLHEILQNFVTNSIKYTKKGGLVLSAKPVTGGVEFSVKDTGIGISKSDKKKVFDKFFRSEDYRTRESNGTGLGLYVTMKLAKIINAKLRVESAINEGSEFLIEVPNLRNAGGASGGGGSKASSA